MERIKSTVVEISSNRTESRSSLDTKAGDHRRRRQYGPGNTHRRRTIEISSAVPTLYKPRKPAAIAGEEGNDAGDKTERPSRETMRRRRQSRPTTEGKGASPETKTHLEKLSYLYSLWKIKFGNKESREKILSLKERRESPFKRLVSSVFVIP